MKAKVYNSRFLLSSLPTVVSKMININQLKSRSLSDRYYHQQASRWKVRHISGRTHLFKEISTVRQKTNRRYNEDLVVCDFTACVYSCRAFENLLLLSNSGCVLIFGRFTIDAKDWLADFFFGDKEKENGSV